MSCRKSEYDVAEVTVLVLCSGDKSGAVDEAAGGPTSRKTAGPRQSKRLRQKKDHRERRQLMITKLMTVKDIKVAVCARFSTIVAESP
jgi:hypothetical protein